MLIEILLFLILGIIAGTITGLIPGIHINLLGVFLVSLSATLLGFLDPIYFIVFIVAMAITHTFVDFIPSIFLGCPDTDTELSILPGHELLKQGKGYEAVLLTCYGSLAAVFVLIIISIPSIIFIPKAYEIIRQGIPYLLILVSFFLIALEKKKTTALFVFLLTGFLGWAVLNMPLKEPLLPLLTGLFGASMLIISIKTKIKIPKQRITKPKIKLYRPLLGSVIASPLCSFLPGLGSGQAAIIGNTIAKTGKRGFLVLVGATNTLVMGFSFVSLYLISKTRTGAAVAIQKIIGTLSIEYVILILAIVMFAGVISFFLTLKLTKFFSKKISKIKYSFVSIITLSILGILTLLVAGFTGLLVLIASTLTGIYCISLGVRRTNMMGCLLLPTILLYLI
ncbi:tripartite tricarboxylate transporter permease [Nanoarchaeota archaeon]